MPAPKFIAIDGPGASGKTTVGLLLAHRLGYAFVDTGSMYRAATLLALERGVDLADETELERLSRHAHIRLPLQDGSPKVYLNGRDVTLDIKRPRVDQAVSIVSKAAGVRRVMVEQQFALAKEGKVVMIGRDIGTVVLPKAELKVYLLASAEVRAGRRTEELQSLGEVVDYQAVLKDLQARDELDSQRQVSPLRSAADARIVDTDALDVEGVVRAIEALFADP